MYTRD
jgi:serine/threonine-protein kinase SRPK3